MPNISVVQVGNEVTDDPGSPDVRWGEEDDLPEAVPTVPREVPMTEHVFSVPASVAVWCCQINGNHTSARMQVTAEQQPDKQRTVSAADVMQPPAPV